MTSENSERQKKLGQFFTSKQIAEFMSDWICYNGPTTILDPAVGKGVFITACKEKIKEHTEFFCYDIDAAMTEYIRENIPDVKHIFTADFLENDWEQKYDAVICNPPYNKFQTIKNRDELIKDFKNKTKIQMSGYTNILGYFLVKSIFQLKCGGRAAFIIPYEFLSTGYGEVLKKYMLQEKSLCSIIKFDNSKDVFDNATTTTCIILIEKGSCNKTSFITLHNEQSLKTITLENIFSQGIVRDHSDLNPNDKWLNLFKGDEKELHNLIDVSSICRVKRGIATGDNNFFAISHSIAQENKISDCCLIPCLTKSPDVKVSIFTKDHYDIMLKNNKKILLFDGTKAITEHDRKYIEKGVQQGSNMRYLTSHRTPWYAIEKKDPAPILISVFNRERFKIIRNEALIHNLTTFHSVHINKKYSKNEDFINIFYCYLVSNVAQSFLSNNKREYGDKLDKFEPNDLNNAKMLNIELLSERDRREILSLYEKIKETYEVSNDVLNRLDSIFSSYLQTENVSLKPKCLTQTRLLCE